MATKIGTGYVTVTPDFSGFQEKVAAKLNSTLGPAMDRIGKDAGRRISKGISENPSLRSSLQPLIKRFRKDGESAGEEIAKHIGKGAKRAEGDMFGLSGAIKEIEKRSGSASSKAKILANDTFGIAHAARDAGKGYQIMRNASRGWEKDAARVDSVSKRLSKGITSLFKDFREVGGNLKAAAGGFGNFEGIMARANRGFQFLRNILGSLKIPALVQGVALLGQSLSALAAGAFAAGAALGPLTGALVAVPALALAAAQAVGALKLAFSGIGNAVKAAVAVQVQGGEQATQTLRNQENAAEAVADAHRTLASSERDAKYAEEDLTKVRKEATRQLEDLRRAADESNLSEREGADALRESRRELAKTLADPKANGLDIRQAEEAVERAQFALESTRIEAKRARADYAEANKKGVEGMPEVVAAKRSLADANRSVADAERGVAKAVRENSDALNKQGSAATALQQKMAELTPSGRKFAKFLISLKPRYDELRETASKGLFPGAEKGIKSALKNAGVIKTIVGETSSALGKLAAKAGQKLGSDAWGRDLGKIGAENTQILERLGDAGLNVSDAFRNILVSAEPLLDWMSEGTVKFSEWLKTSSQAGRETGSLGHFFEETREAMERVWRILKPLGEGILNVGHVAKGLGNEILDSLGDAAEGWAKWTKSTEGQNQLKHYFKEVKPAIYAIGRLVRDATDDFADLGRQKGVATLIESIRTGLLPLLKNGAGAITGFTSGFIGNLDKLHKEGVPILDAFLVTLAEHAAQAGTAIAKALFNAFINSSVWGKLAIGGWLFSKVGGFGILGQVLGSKLGGAAGTEGASVLASTLGKALGPALGAVGIANIVTSATKGDWKDAGFEAGGALAGGIAGAFIGGPLGAAAGVGIGSILGEAVSGLFQSSKKIGPIQKALADSARGVTRALRSQATAAEAVERADENLRTAHAKVHRETGLLRKAEEALANARKNHDGSRQVAIREGEVRAQLQKTKKAVNDLRFAKEAAKFAEKAEGRSGAEVVHATAIALAADKSRIAAIRQRIHEEGRTTELNEAAGRAAEKFFEDESKYNEALAQVRHNVGTKYARTLEEMTESQHRFGAAGKVLTDRLETLKATIADLSDRGAREPMSPLNESLRKARGELGTTQRELVHFINHNDSALKGFAEKAGNHVGKLGDAFKSLETATGESTQSIFDNLTTALGALGAAKIPKFAWKFIDAVVARDPNGASLGRQKGGPVPAHATGGLAAIVPGHSTGDRHTLALGGRPVAKVESGEGIFVGNRKMMAAAKAANDAVPRFQTGGIAKRAAGGLLEPKLEGNAGPLKQLGQRAIHKVFEGAKGALDKQRSLGGGAGGSIANAGPLQQFNRIFPSHTLSELTGKARFSEALVARIARWAGLPGRLFGQIAHGESDFYPGVYGIDPGGSIGRGLWQITSGVGNDAMIAQFGGPEAMFNPLINAEVAKKIYDVAGIGAWYGTKFVTGLQGGGLLKAATGDLLELARGGGFDPEGRKSKFAPLLRRSTSGALRGTAARAVAWFKNNLGTQEGSAKQEAWGPNPWCGYAFGADMTAQGVPLPPNPGYTGSYEDEWDNGSDPVSGLGSAQPGDFLGFNGEHTAMYEGGGRMISGNWGNEVAEAAVSDESEPLTSVRRPRYPGGSGAPGAADTGGAATKETKPKEEVPNEYKGVKAKGRINFGPMPKTLSEINAELVELGGKDGTHGLVTKYKAAAEDAAKSKKPATAKAIRENLALIRARIRGLQQRRTALRFKAVKKHLSTRFRKATERFGAYGRLIEEAQEAYDGASQFATQVTDLEPQPQEIPVQQKGESDKAYEARQEAAEKAYVAQYTAYIEGQERPAYASVLERAADWRNAILRAEIFGFGKGQPSVADSQGAWEGQTRGVDSQIEQIKAFAKVVLERRDDWVKKWEGEKAHKGKHPKPSDYPSWLTQQLKERAEDLKERLPVLKLKDTKLRASIQEARELFFPGGKNRLGPDGPVGKGVPADAIAGTGTLEEGLREVQGIHKFPDQHGLMGAAQIGPPNVPGRLGGVIWDVNNSISELGIKVSSALHGLEKPASESGGADNSERTQLLEGLLREANERLSIKGALEGVVSQFKASYPLGNLPFAGTFHTGGIVNVPGGGDAIAHVRDQEGIFRPDQMAALAPAGSGGGELRVIVNGDIHQKPGDTRDPIEVLESDPRGERYIRRVVSTTPPAPGGGNGFGRVLRP